MRTFIKIFNGKDGAQVEQQPFPLQKHKMGRLCAESRRKNHKGTVLFIKKFQLSLNFSQKGIDKWGKMCYNGSAKGKSRYSLLSNNAR